MSISRLKKDGSIRYLTKAHSTCSWTKKMPQIHKRCSIHRHAHGRTTPQTYDDNIIFGARKKRMKNNFITKRNIFVFFFYTLKRGCYEYDLFVSLSFTLLLFRFYGFLWEYCVLTFHCFVCVCMYSHIYTHVYIYT